MAKQQYTSEKEVQGLQRLTDLEKMIEEVLSKPKIEWEDIKHLTASENRKFFDRVGELFNNLKGEEKDAFEEKIAGIINPETKKQIWEVNHLNITNAIYRLMGDTGQMPSKTLLAKYNLAARISPLTA